RHEAADDGDLGRWEATGEVEQGESAVECRRLIAEGGVAEGFDPLQTSDRLPSAEISEIGPHIHLHRRYVVAPIPHRGVAFEKSESFFVLLQQGFEEGRSKVSSPLNMRYTCTNSSSSSPLKA